MSTLRGLYQQPTFLGDLSYAASSFLWISQSFIAKDNFNGYFNAAF